MGIESPVGSEASGQPIKLPLIETEEELAQASARYKATMVRGIERPSPAEKPVETVFDVKIY